jgi:hypothetical protein
MITNSVLTSSLAAGLISVNTALPGSSTSISVVFAPNSNRFIDEGWICPAIMRDQCTKTLGHASCTDPEDGSNQIAEGILNIMQI